MAGGAYRYLDLIDEWARDFGITDPAIVADAKKLSMTQQDRLAYSFVEGDARSSISFAAVILNRKRHSEPEHYAALKFRDGRVALVTAVRKEDLNWGSARSPLDGEPPQEAAERLVGEIDRAYWQDDHSFRFNVQHDNTHGMKFPGKPRGDVFGYNLPDALGWMIYQSETVPGGRAECIFDKNLHERIEVDFWSEQSDYPGLMEIVYSYESQVLLRRVLLNIERKRFHDAQSCFMARLDPEILRVCRKIGNFSPGFYNWLAGNGNPENAPRRIQAAKAYPLFFRYLCEDELSEVIDCGKQLKPALARRLGVDTYSGHKDCTAPIREATVGRLRDHFNPRTDLLPLPKTPVLWHYLDRLPVEHWPCKRDDMRKFSGVLREAEYFAREFQVSPFDALKSWKGQWSKACEDLGLKNYVLNFSSWQSESSVVKDAGDYATRVYQALYLPVLLQQAGREGMEINPSWLKGCPGKGGNNVFAAMFGDVSMRTVLDLSRRWHERIRTFDIRMKGINLLQGGLSWPALTPPQTAPNGVQLVPVETQEGLKQEGAAMGHCVGGYTSQCHAGSSFVISLRDAAGERLSTLELEGEPFRLRIRQHSAGRNWIVLREAAEAASWYVDSINKGRIPVDWAAITAHREAAKKSIDNGTITQTVGFDPYNLTACAQAYEIFRPFLPGAFRHIDYEGWRARMNVVEAMRSVLTEERARAAAGPGPAP